MRRKNKLLAVFAIGATVLLSGCGRALVDAFTGIGSLPRICVVGIRAQVIGREIKFNPVVANRGISNNHWAFRVTQFPVLSEPGGVLGEFEVPAGFPVPPAPSGASAGQEIMIPDTLLVTGSSNRLSYDPAKLYTIETYLTSADQTFDTASQGCNRIRQSFRGGQPV